MSSHNRGRGGGGRGGGGRTKKPMINNEDPVQVMFGEISGYLDSRHDRRERLVKLSRDITIESKRIIFCLHRIKSEEDRSEVLAEAERRLQEVKEKLWTQVAEELRSQDDYQFLRAYSPGLQEWVEALSFYHFLTTNKIISYQETQDELRFKLPAKEEREGELEATVTIPQSEYVLGLADLTGELMRNAINALGAGEMEETPRDIGQKLHTLKQSCKKVENACYAISVRGSEIPRNHWADIFSRKDEDRAEEFSYRTVDDFS